MRVKGKGCIDFEYRMNIKLHNKIF